MKKEYPVWRLVIQKVANLHEIETFWNLDDLIMANAMLDMQADIEMDVSRKKLNEHR